MKLLFEHTDSVLYVRYVAFGGSAALATMGLVIGRKPEGVRLPPPPPLNVFYRTTAAERAARDLDVFCVTGAPSR